MKYNFYNKNVIITGGTGGIGMVITMGFLKSGATVLIIGRHKRKLSQFYKENPLFKKQIKIFQADVSRPIDITKLKPYINKVFKGKVDVLVNAAAIYGPIGKLEDLDLYFWKKTIEINLMGTVSMCKLVIPFMKKYKHGKIINFSGGGDGPFPNFTAYSSSKGAILRFTESLAEELRKFKIYVNAIAPGPVNTNLLEEVLKTGQEKVGKEFYIKSLKQKKEGGVSPEKTKELVLFLASNQSKNITGKMISAFRDKWVEFPKHIKEISSSDIYNMRRIKPGDRGYDW